jgi:hypothetical protein
MGSRGLAQKAVSHLAKPVNAALKGEGVGGHQVTAQRNSWREIAAVLCRRW